MYPGTNRNQGSLLNCLYPGHPVGTLGSWLLHRQWNWDHHQQCTGWRPGSLLLSAALWYSSHSASASYTNLLENLTRCLYYTQPWSAHCPLLPGSCYACLIQSLVENLWTEDLFDPLNWKVFMIKGKKRHSVCLILIELCILNMINLLFYIVECKVVAWISMG